MKPKNKIVLLTSLFLLFLFSLSRAQEQITITTYYPSPYGSYRDLEVSNKLSGRGVSPTTGPAGNVDIVIFAQNTAPDTTIPDKYGVYARTWAGGNVGGALARAWLDNTGNIWQMAVYGYAPTGSRRYAGYFDGDVIITGNLQVNGGLAASSCVDYLGNIVAECPVGSYAVACGAGTCAAPGNLSSPGACPVAGYMICIRHG